MHVKDIMTKNVETVCENASIQEAAQKMAQRNIGFLPVIRDGQIVGVLTDRDITVRETALEKNSSLSHVGDIMTREIISCFDDHRVQIALDKMSRYGVWRLIVLDRQEKLQGVISKSDIDQKTSCENPTLEIPFL